MNALDATAKLAQLNVRIEALNVAYKELWSDFDLRSHALRLNEIQAELEQERGEIVEKLRSVSL